MVIGIIGGGASGMAAALAASERAQVLLFERQARVGRKLLATGNGRCNLTNLHAGPQSYHGADAAFARGAMEAYPVADTLDWFHNMGLYTVAEDSGRVYPYSDQANSVVDILRFALERENVELLAGTEVTKVKRAGEGFLVQTQEGVYTCDRLIIACGGLAGTKLGGSMAGYQLLRSLGHHVTRLRPTLVQLKSSWSGCQALKGVRANCKISVYHNDTLFAQSAGELQFAEYGITGPVVFEVSRDVCQGGGKWTCRLDFLPDITEETLMQLLDKRVARAFSREELLTGILHNRLGRVLTATAGLRTQGSAFDLSEEELKELCHAVKDLELTLTEPLGMDSAQVTAGGAETGEFDPQTLESRLVPGLYACGEVLDIDGDCGGYNLQWAWSSGRLAGASAGRNV